MIVKFDNVIIVRSTCRIVCTFDNKCVACFLVFVTYNNLHLEFAWITPEYNLQSCLLFWLVFQSDLGKVWEFFHQVFYIDFDILKLESHLLNLAVRELLFVWFIKLLQCFSSNFKLWTMLPFTLMWSCYLSFHVTRSGTFSPTIVIRSTKAE